MIFKMNNMFWSINESTGYRHIDVIYNGRIIMAVVSHRTSSVWTASVIPMGFSFTLDEIQGFSDAFTVLPVLMEFLQTDEISEQEMQNYLLTL